MHHIYHTEGIILGSRGYGEAGKYYSVFTRDLGMIYASAQGVRKISSKLRFVLQDYAYLKIDLVQGKDFWRIITAEKTGYLEKITKKTETFKIFNNIARLLKRLLPGTEANEPLFQAVVSGLLDLENAHTKEEFEDQEIGLVLNILKKLGYVEGGHEAASRAQAISLINRVLKETHL
ncbi:MAG: DNA repair protein RecO [Patescibacteria group bacterium]